jgi:hypothetical protein
LSLIDLNNLPPDVQATIGRKETDGERRVRLVKDLIVFTLAIILLIIVVAYSLDVLLAATTTASDKRWAQSIISAIAGGVIGYLLRR